MKVVKIMPEIYVFTQRFCHGQDATQGQFLRAL